MPKEKLFSQTKVCPVCKLSFSNRKKWESRGIWDEIKYCSDKCRKNSRAKTQVKQTTSTMPKTKKYD